MIGCRCVIGQPEVGRKRGSIGRKLALSSTRTKNQQFSRDPAGKPVGVRVPPFALFFLSESWRGTTQEINASSFSERPSAGFSSWQRFSSLQPSELPAYGLL